MFIELNKNINYLVKFVAVGGRAMRLTALMLSFLVVIVIKPHS